MKKTNSKILYEIALKTAVQQGSIKTLLRESSLKAILMEDLNNDDVESLRTAVESTLQAVDANIKTAQESGMSSVSDYFQKIKASLGKANELVRSLDLADDSGVAGKLKSFFGSKVSVPRAMQSVINLQNQANTAASTMGNAFELITRNLKSANISDDVSLKDLEQDKHGVNADQLKSAISKAFNASKPKGFMSKIGSFLGKMKLASIPGADDVEDFPFDAVQDEVLNMTWGDFQKMGQSTSKAADAAEKSNVDTSAIKDINAEASEESSSSGSKGGDAESDEFEKQKEDIRKRGEAAMGTPGGEKGEKKNAGDEIPKMDGSEKDGSFEEDPDSKQGQLVDVDPAESDPAKEIKAVASSAASTPMSPKDAVSQALSDWESSLSASSQKTLSAKNRSSSLKDAIFTGIDKGKDAVEKAVSKAVKDWRSEHEETLVKSKRFAAKNFDSLQQLIPQLAAQVLAQTKESRKRKITTTEIRKFVNKKLNSAFYPDNRLYETWQKNAGLLKD